MAPALAGCDVREYARRHGGKLRLSIATGPVGGTYYVYGAAIAALIGRHLPNAEATAEVTSASIDNLKLLATGRADIAFSVAPTLRDALHGSGSFARLGRVPARVIATLYPNLMHLVTLEGTGIASLAGLAGRVVSLGPPGSGTEEMAVIIVRAAGLDPDSGIRRHGLAPGPAGEALEDGKLDAFFWSGGAGTAALVDLAVSARGRMRLVPLGEIVATLQAAHGPALFQPAPIPAGSYPGLGTDVPTVATPNLLVVDAAMSEALVYEITRALFDRKDELAAVVRVAAELSPERGAAPAPAPLHPGALRFYRERGVARP